MSLWSGVFPISNRDRYIKQYGYTKTIQFATSLTAHPRRLDPPDVPGYLASHPNLLPIRRAIHGGNMPPTTTTRLFDQWAGGRVFRRGLDPQSRVFTVPTTRGEPVIVFAEAYTPHEHAVPTQCMTIARAHMAPKPPLQQVSLSHHIQRNEEEEEEEEDDENEDGVRIGGIELGSEDTDVSATESENEYDKDDPMYASDSEPVKKQRRPGSLAELNPVPQFDGRIFLYEHGTFELGGVTHVADHTYVVDGQIVRTSVSTLVGAFLSPFDGRARADATARGNGWRSKPYRAEVEAATAAIVPFDEEDPEPYLEELGRQTYLFWNRNRDRGTAMHETLELFCDGKLPRERIEVLAKDAPEYRFFLQWWDGWFADSGLVVWRVELRTFMRVGDTTVTGSIDLILQDPETGELVIVDYKRATTGVSRYGWRRALKEGGDDPAFRGEPYEWVKAPVPSYATKALGPLADLWDSKYTKYGMQQNCYAHMLEEEAGFTVRAIYLLILGPYQKTYDLMPIERLVEPMDNLIEAIQCKPDEAEIRAAAESKFRRGLAKLAAAAEEELTPAQAAFVAETGPIGPALDCGDDGEFKDQFKLQIEKQRQRLWMKAWTTRPMVLV